MRNSHSPGRTAPGIFLLTVFLLAMTAMFCRPAAAVVREGRVLGPFPTVRGIHGDTLDFYEVRPTHLLLVFFSIYSETNAELLLDFAGSLHLDPAFPLPLQVVAINMDPSETAVQRYVDRLQLPFSVMLDSALDLSRMFGVKEMPTLVLIDPHRTVRMAVAGFSLQQAEDVRSRIESVTGVRPPPPRITDEQAAETDTMYRERRMISSGALSAGFCQVCDSLAMYVSKAGILLTYNFRTEELREVSSDVASAGWSPDGRSVVYSGKERPGLWIKELDGPARKISTIGDRPAWSPAGDLIAFVVNNNDVWISRLSTGKRWKVAATGSHVEWSPDGTLLMVKDARDRIWLISPYSRASFFRRVFD